MDYKTEMIKENTEVQIFNSIDDINTYLVNLFTGIINESIKLRNICSIALSGGNTPKMFYEKLASQSLINWSKVHFFLVDERFVLPEHKDNNFSMIKKTLFDKINMSDSNLHSINTTIDSPKKSASLYEKELTSFFKIDRPDVFPIFDIILLGIGSDGHTASLFPDTEALYEKTKMTTTSKTKHFMHERISLTFPVINNSINVVFLVTGSEKKEIIEKIINENADLPASRIKPNNSKLIFILDEKSALMINYK